MVYIKQLVVATLLLLVSAFADHAVAAENTTKVADGVYSYAPGDGYASMFVVASDGVVAIEPVHTKHATGMLKAIRSVTDKPVRYLLHSHNHWDHSSGGQVFRDAGAKILAPTWRSPTKAGRANAETSRSAAQPLKCIISASATASA